MRIKKIYKIDKQFSIHIFQKYLLIIFIGLVAFLINCKPQESENLKIQFIKDLNAIYPYIRTIINGPIIDAELEPGRPSEQGEYSYYYRFLITEYETFDQIYLERIGIYDEDGIDRRLTSHVFIDINRIFPETLEEEFRDIESIQWIDVRNVRLVINSKEYKLNITDFL